MFGGRYMKFKRQESFRFAFDPPVEMTFTTLSNNPILGNGQSKASGQILDISPHGMKMFSDVQMGENITKHMQLEIHFVLDTQPIKAYGEIIWRKPFGRGHQYGILLNDQPAVEELIIDEMKSRRRKEVKQAKNKL